jgi:hypothetical protein
MAQPPRSIKCKYGCLVVQPIRRLINRIVHLSCENPGVVVGDGAVGKVSQSLQQYAALRQSRTYSFRICLIRSSSRPTTLDIIYHQRFPWRIRSYRLRQLLCPGRCPVSSTLGWSDFEADGGLCPLARSWWRIGHGRWDYRQPRTLGYRRSRRLRVSTSYLFRNASDVPRYLHPY